MTPLDPGTAARAGDARVCAGRPPRALRRVLLAGVLAAAVCAVGCGQEPPAPDQSGRFAGVVLEVLRGTELERLTLPASLPPDFVAEERRAWKLSTLFGSGFAGRTSVLEAHAAEGRPAVFGDALTASPQGIWVLRTNRKGVAVLAQVDPADPFPAFHGRGGNRGRPGDAEGERVHEVVRLRLVLGPSTEQRPERVSAAPALVVEVDGVARTLDEQAWAQVEKLTVAGDSGDGSRPAWSLRVLAKHLAGASARVVAVLGAEGQRQEIDPGAWADAARVPVLRLNRRGDLKFHWIDAAGAPLDSAPSLRGAERVLIVTR